MKRVPKRVLSTNSERRIHRATKRTRHSFSSIDKPTIDLAGDVQMLRLKRLCEDFGGSLFGFTASILKDLACLTTQQIVTVRHQIAALAKVSASARTLEAGIVRPFRADTHDRS